MLGQRPSSNTSPEKKTKRFHGSQLIQFPIKLDPENMIGIECILPSKPLWFIRKRIIIKKYPNIKMM